MRRGDRTWPSFEEMTTNITLTFQSNDSLARFTSYIVRRPALIKPGVILLQLYNMKCSKAAHIDHLAFSILL